MNLSLAISTLRTLDQMGRYVFQRHNLRTAFPMDSDKTFTEGIARMVAAGVLRRGARGVYVNENANSRDGWTIEHIAQALRPADLNYVSLESALSEYGVISQIPIDRITVMTTGRSGTFKTAYGIIEFTHTQRTPEQIRAGTTQDTTAGRPLALAQPVMARQDLQRVGRNLHLVSRQAFDDIVSELERSTPRNPTNPAAGRRPKPK